MFRRSFIIQSAVALQSAAILQRAVASPIMNTQSSPQVDTEDAFESAAQILVEAVRSQQVQSASMVVRRGDRTFARAFGRANIDSPFLLGSISKPICLTALMALFDDGLFQLDEPVQKYLPEFRGDRREKVKVAHLLTHVSGLPDQLPNNAHLRRSHASLAAFTQAAMEVPLGFEPGTKYEYSSMAILLACEIAQRLSGKCIAELVSERVLKPLGLTRSALGVGELKRDELVSMQIEHAAPEAGGGDPTAKDWDWNSDYWRQLGAPWGGVHASAGNVMRFLEAFRNPPRGFLTTTTADLMTRNHNPSGMIARGLGFAVGNQTLCTGCTATAYGHTGSTGTVAWLDSQRDMACVVLTSLPAQAVTPHPRDLVTARLNRG